MFHVHIFYIDFVDIKLTTENFPCVLMYNKCMGLCQLGWCREEELDGCPPEFQSPNYRSPHKQMTNTDAMFHFHVNEHLVQNDIFVAKVGQGTQLRVKLAILLSNSGIIPASFHGTQQDSEMS